MTARANSVKPFAYLSEIFEQLPRAKTKADFETLLPWHVKATLQERDHPAQAVSVIS